MRKIHIISEDLNIYETKKGLCTAVNDDPLFCLLLAEIILDTLLKHDEGSPRKVKADRGVLKTFMKMNEAGRRLSISILADAYIHSNNEKEAQD